MSIWVELRNSSFDDKLENTINYAELQSLVDEVIINKKNFIKKNDQYSLVVSPLRAFNVHSGYGGWKNCHFFVSFSIVCHEW